MTIAVTPTWQRSIERALRDAVNVGVTALEELGGTEDQAQPATYARRAS